MPDSIQQSPRTSAGVPASTATAVATISNGQVTQIAVISGGSGYSSAPNVAIIGGGGTGASALANVANGSVTAIKVLTMGRGYTSTPTVTIAGGPALLDYGILTSPDPLQVPQNNYPISQLTLNVSNSGSVVVNCSSFTLLLPGPSEYAQDLTDNFTNISVQVPSDQQGNPLWTSKQNQGSFTLTPVSSNAGEIGGAGLSFIFGNIMVNSSVGLWQVAITEVASSSLQPAGSRAAPPIAIQKWPPQFSISGPTANPVEVLWNGSTEVAWNVTGAGVSTTLLYDVDGTGVKPFPVSNVGSKQVSNLTNSHGVTFTVQASITPPGHSTPMTAQQQIHVDVMPNPTIDFTIQPNPLAPGKPVTFTLAWTLVDVSDFQITANDGPNGSSYSLQVPVAKQGTFVVTPRNLNVTYTLTVLSTASPEDAPEKEK